MNQFKVFAMKESLKVRHALYSVTSAKMYDLRISGKMECIGGNQCYVSTPRGDYAKDKVVLFLTDVFGIIIRYVAYIRQLTRSLSTASRQ